MTAEVNACIYLELSYTNPEVHKTTVLSIEVGMHACRDVSGVGLPPSMVPLEHPRHPWIRCSTFALIPKDLGGFCYVEDIQGRRCVRIQCIAQHLAQLHRVSILSKMLSCTLLTEDFEAPVACDRGVPCSRCRLAVADAPILVPQNGLLVIGAPSGQDADVLIDEPRVSGRHARLEVIPCNGGSKCNRDYRCPPPVDSSINQGLDIGS